MECPPWRVIDPVNPPDLLWVAEQVPVANESLRQKDTAVAVGRVGWCAVKCEVGGDWAGPPSICLLMASPFLS